MSEEDSSKKSKEYRDSEVLFKSVDRELSSDYLTWWETAFVEFISFYREAQVDGTEDALRCRMLASTRLAQLGLSMFNFFSSSAVVIQNGSADVEACNAVSRVVSMMVERKVDGWITLSKKGLN